MDGTFESFLGWIQLFGVLPYLDFHLRINSANLVQGALFRFANLFLLPLHVAWLSTVRPSFHRFPCKSSLVIYLLLPVVNSYVFIRHFLLPKTLVQLRRSLVVFSCKFGCRVLFNKVKKTISNLKMKLLDDIMMILLSTF